MTPDTPATLPVLRVEDLETFRAEDYASPECLALAGELLDAQAIIARLTSERDALQLKLENTRASGKIVCEAFERLKAAHALATPPVKGAPT